MPTILVKKEDLESLIGKKVSSEEIESFLPWVKGEFKGYDEKSGEIKVELNDSNRPDLWCTEGIARQVRLKLGQKHSEYPFFQKKAGKNKYEIIVEGGVREIRPFIAACGVSNFVMTAEALAQFIQTQEKLADVFGQKRKLLSIGIYHLDPVTFPLSYKTVSAESVRFVPLGFDRPMNLKEILEEHPKGKAHRGIFKNGNNLPLFVDSKGVILSFPPIINSREAGEVQAGNQNLMVEVTGTDLRLVALVLNILAANLHDRGATILPVKVSYPYKTDLGQSITFPCRIESSLEVPLSEVQRLLGVPLKIAEVRSALSSYGHQVMGNQKMVVVTPPPYRDDLIHPVDIIEDVAISRGYDSFAPEMPREFTRGSLSPEEEFSDRLREYFVGFGFQEIISNILFSREELVEKMNLEAPEKPLVEVDNVMTAQYGIVRNHILPSLLRVESASGKAFYPHKIFEVGEVAEQDPAADIGSRTRLQLSALIAHPTASFSELHSYWEMLAFYILRDGFESYALNAASHPSFNPGRFGKILVRRKDGVSIDLGHLGEIHPEVLSRWQIGVPCAALSLDVTAFLTLFS